MTTCPVLDSLYCCRITLHNRSTGFGHVAQASQQLLNKTNKTHSQSSSLSLAHSAFTMGDNTAWQTCHNQAPLEGGKKKKKLKMGR